MLAALASGTLMAQTKGRTFQQLGRVIAVPHSNVQIPYRDDNSDNPDASIVIAKNLGPTGFTYVLDNGWLVTGATDVTFGGPDMIGVQFRPSVNCHATTLSAAITLFEGTKSVRLGIYDNNGMGGVGTLIQDGATTRMGNFGSCCSLAKVTLTNGGAALTAGHDYFLVATAGASDSGLVWSFVSPAGGGANGQSFNNTNTGFTWDAEWTYYAAYEVQGTNP